jgi:hypothetical protein
MDYQPRSIRSKKVLSKKGKQNTTEKTKIPTEQEISKSTLKRLHTLGTQKFGPSPFSQHFNRWLNNVEAVLSEFKSHPNMSLDCQFVKETEQAVHSIRLKLEEIHQEEVLVEKTARTLFSTNKRLEHLNQDYIHTSKALTNKKRRRLKHLYTSIEQTKKEQENVIKLKTGLLKRYSSKDREKKEIHLLNELTNKQRQIELMLLDFKIQQKNLRDYYEKKKHPLQEQTKLFKQAIETLETDASLEERWFACESLIDSINTFLQRKALNSAG